MDEALVVLQHHLRQAHLTCLCKRDSPTSISVHYFDMTNAQFGTDEQQIDDIIRDRFQSAVLNQTASAARASNEWTVLEEGIRKRKDYGTDICLARQDDALYLFGLPEVVKDLCERFGQVKQRYQLQACRISLSEDQVGTFTSRCHR